MAESENYKTRLRNISSSLEKIVECPVCLDTIRIPFKTCSRGHGVCNSCCEKLKNCPTCQGPFIIENPVCLKNILEAIPRQCKYHGDGCEDVVEPASDHEEFCGFRPVKCRDRNCNTVTPLIKLMDHYKKEHHQWFLRYKANSTEFLVWSNFDPEKRQHSPPLIFVFDNIFWFNENFNQNQKYLEITFEATPIGKLKNDYFVKVKVEKGDFLYASTLKASVVKGCQKEENTNWDNCMRIPQSSLSNLILERNFKYELKFFACKK
ncbi:uncharacterized protein LOC128991432 [Macrosteles quadrilineatus]|uniref:uncharacterized protein LOC128991432 n=1 Tax=Macrosteles quadrilineatus TaxID=74068 RepID=UPI0023E0E2A1|nr:uncharacterized protein LOC128991432 [Macrosteles quadrilineatus]XP_054270288.1 uncharacterized protein LOC128991432 [Macrosteles quadrilineatus]XP_054270296.1 uncharacterized protein LOC128991432 [Macrosteles quadrilineatus]